MKRYILPTIVASVGVMFLASKGVTFMTIDYWVIYFSLFCSGYMLASSDNK